MADTEDDYGTTDNVTLTSDGQNNSFTSKALEKLEAIMRVVATDQMFYEQVLRGLNINSDSVNNLVLPAYNKAVELFAKASSGTTVSDSEVLATTTALVNGNKLSSDEFVVQAGPNFDKNNEIEVHENGSQFYNPYDGMPIPNSTQSYESTRANTEKDIYDLTRSRSNTGGMPYPSTAADDRDERTPNVPAVRAGTDGSADSAERQATITARAAAQTRNETEDRLGREGATTSSVTRIEEIITNPGSAPSARPTMNLAERQTGDTGQRVISNTPGVNPSINRAESNQGALEAARNLTDSQRVNGGGGQEQERTAQAAATVTNGIVRGEDLNHQAVAAAKTVLIGDQDGDGVLSAGENTALENFYAQMSGATAEAKQGFADQVAKQTDIDSATHRDTAKAAESADTLQQVKLDQIDSYNVSEKIKDQAKNAVLGGNTSSASDLVKWFTGAVAPAAAAGGAPATPGVTNPLEVPQFNDETRINPGGVGGVGRF